MFNQPNGKVIIALIVVAMILIFCAAKSRGSDVSEALKNISVSINIDDGDYYGSGETVYYAPAPVVYVTPPPVVCYNPPTYYYDPPSRHHNYRQRSSGYRDSRGLFYSNSPKPQSYWCSRCRMKVYNPNHYHYR